ncbi:MAG: DNA topoisomerase IV subunit A [Bacilli bacterium]|nr:DNA topoisomerase IV subunit A [Bacilli bacterium]
MNELIKRIYDKTLEDIMEDRFSRYAKAIIQDRAIPDVRDGLKPVQRRILYGMYHDGNTYDKPTRKSAKTVGSIMGNFHPHGDSSIYDAMVRMSQWWKQNTPYIEMQGNNGSMDGDSAAAMRYTEARLAKISNELLKDIDKDTVIWAPNFDDTMNEPTVLPAKFPNLLVNGSTGISAGYATNIPPHNLGEVIDATIKRIDSPNCHPDTIFDIIKGPDFPTGAIVEGKSGLLEALKTGRGKVVVRSRHEFVTTKGKEQIIITEIPFDVNKANLVKRMSELVLDKKVEGVAEIRDESDRHDPVRIVIDLKKDANKEMILNYFYKNSELQINYNYNMVAIVDRCPETLGVIGIIDAYIKHFEEVITRRTEFDLKKARARMHIVEGMIKAIEILDKVIKTIRASKNKADAIVNLQKEYGFTEIQADYIVTLQLYRLTNSDINDFIEEYNNLKKIIEGLEVILSDKEKLKGVMKNELRNVKREYATPRKTEIKDEVLDTTIDEKAMIPKEDVIVLVTRDGYIKRCSIRSFTSAGIDPVLKDNDYVIGFYEANTLDTILVFTSLGNFLFIPVYTIPDTKWKDLGKHVSNLVPLGDSEEVISCIHVKDFNEDLDITLASRNGMIKRTKLSEFLLLRYNKPVNCMKLKDNDTLITAFVSLYNNIFVSTRNGYGLWYDITEIPLVGLRTSGVKSINLKDDTVAMVNNFDNVDYISLITDKKTGKRMKLSEFEKSTRARRGLMIIKEVKSKPYHVLKTFTEANNSHLVLRTDEIVELKLTELPIMDRYSTGSAISKKEIIDCNIKVNLVKKNEKIENKIDENVEKPKISLKEIDERLLTIDDFL